MLSRSRAFMLFCAVAVALAAPPTWPRSVAFTPVNAHVAIDYSGRKQTGKASYYNRKFSHKTMADGTRMDPRSNAAASKTQPLGTRAKVRNLRNGRSAVVEIRDRGPYVKGRIIDLTPKTAMRLGMRTAGVVPVEVVPIRIPQPDGSIRLGVAVAESQPQKPSVEPGSRSDLSLADAAISRPGTSQDISRSNQIVVP